MLKGFEIERYGHPYKIELYLVKSCQGEKSHIDLKEPSKYFAGGL